MPFPRPSGSVLRAGNLLAASQRRIIFPLAAQWRRLHREHVSRHWICQTPHPLSLSICRPLIHAFRMGLTHSLTTTEQGALHPSYSLALSCSGYIAPYVSAAVSVSHLAVVFAYAIAAKVNPNITEYRCCNPPCSFFRANISPGRQPSMKRSNFRTDFLSWDII